jgi:DNA-binding XRE family transcriptional regulator
LAGEAVDDADLPPLPTPDQSGRYPAVEYARVSIARDLIRERKSVGLTQAALARLTGLRQETISRLESGKHTPTTRTVERITRAVEARRQRLRRGKRAAAKA